MNAYCPWGLVIGCLDLPNHDFVEPKSRPSVSLGKEHLLDVSYPAAHDQSCAWREEKWAYLVMVFDTKL
jgi:hypothetical protein